jgi:beta-lactamase family protein
MKSNSVEAAIVKLVDGGQLAGAVALVWRDREVDTAAVGRRHLASGLPVERDTIFRIASMTKPVTTVAALMLLDDGRFALDDRSVLIFLAHNMLELSQMARGIGLGVWNAIASFHAIATS